MDKITDKNHTEGWVPLHMMDLYYVIYTLHAHGGNRTKTAKALNISLRTVRNRIEKAVSMGIEVPEPEKGVEKFTWGD